MEMMFSYDCVAVKTRVVASTFTWPVELTEDQVKRVKASAESGKYAAIDEDPAIADVFMKVYDEAMEIARQQEWGHMVGKDILPDNFRYPTEA